MALYLANYHHRELRRLLTAVEHQGAVIAELQQTSNEVSERTIRILDILEQTQPVALSRAVAAIENEYGVPPDFGSAARQMTTDAAAGLLRVKGIPDIAEEYRNRGAQAILTALRERAKADTIDIHTEILAWSFLIGDLDQAAQSAQTVLEYDPTNANARNYMGHICQERGQLGAAESHYESLLHGAHTNYWTAVALGNLAIVSRRRGDMATAISLHNEALDLGYRVGSIDVVANELASLGLIASIQGNYDDAECLVLQALRLHESIGWPRGVSICSSYLGSIAMLQRKWDDAQQFYERALSISERAEYLVGTASSIGNLGLLARNRGDAKKAAELLEEARVLHVYADNLEGEGRACGALGGLLLGQNMPKQASELLWRAVEIDRQLGTRIGMPGTDYAEHLNNLSVALRRSGDLMRAWETCSEALGLFRTVNNRRGEASACVNLGTIAGASGDLDTANKYFLQGYDVWAEVGDVRGQIVCLSNLAVSYRRSGQLQEAIEFRWQAIAVQKDVVDTTAIADQLLEIGAIEEFRGEYGAARGLWVAAASIYRQNNTHPEVVEKLQQWLAELPSSIPESH